MARIDSETVSQQSVLFGCHTVMRKRHKYYMQAQRGGRRWSVCSGMQLARFSLTPVRKTGAAQTADLVEPL